MTALRELYQQMIIDHGRHPRNKGELPTATYQKEGFNPLCGDHIILYVEEQEGRLCDLRFQGAGCAISLASASLLTETIKGKTMTEAMAIFTDFHRYITEGAESDRLGKLIVLGGVREFPSRVKCAALAWHTLKAIWAPEDHRVTTE